MSNRYLSFSAIGPAGLDRFICLILLIFLVPCLDAFIGASLNIQARVDQQEITIGDPIIYTIEIEREPAVEVQIPKLEKKIGNFQVKKLLSEKTKKKKGKIVDQHRYLITTFVTGTQIIPSFTVFAVDDYGKKTEIKSEGLIVKVNSVIPPDSDAKEIRGIKNIIIKRNILYFVLIALAVLAALAALGYLVVKALKFKKKAPSAIEVAIQTAEEVAIQRLKELKLSDMLKKGKVKEYYFLLSEIMRQYLENRFQVPAKERTTDEIADNLSQISAAQDQANSFKEFFAYCDMVKFSPFVPSEIASEDMINKAKEMIRLTRPKPAAKTA